MKECNAIELNNVCKSFKTKYNAPDDGKHHLKKTFVKEFSVLKGVTFEIKKGEVMGIIGRNGSGKSTLLNIIAGIMAADSGTVEKSGTVASILELGMGFHPDMSGRENIYIKGALYGFSKKQLDEKIDSIIAYSELGDFIDQPVRTYSSGMNGRLAFSIMVNVDADVLLVDEVLSTGDSVFASKALAHFKNIVKTGRTVIIVSHSLNQIREMCSAAIWIESGAIREIGDSKIVCGHYEREMNESPEVLKVLSDSGNPIAQNTLGCRYRDGECVEKDLEKAECLFRLSVMSGNDEAMVNLANLLRGRNGCESEIFELYRKASDRGNSEARVRLSSMYGDGADHLREELIGYYRNLAKTGCARRIFEYADVVLKSKWTSESRTEALKLFLESAEKGYIPAIYQSAIMIRDGIGAPKDYKKSLELFEKAAEGNDVRAQIYLADLYYDGIFVTKDDPTAFRWYLKAAKNGNANARYRVATMYYEGTGIQKNIDESQYWFNLIRNQNLTGHYFEMGNELPFNDHLKQECTKLASELGNPLAKIRLSEMYRDGKGTEIDSQKALLLFWESAESGNVAALANIVTMFSNGVLDKSDDSGKALSMMKQMALNGDAEAARRLGNMYYDGNGVQEDAEEAFHWYNISLNAGDSWCKFRLGEMCRDGKGTEADLQKALSFFWESANSGNVSALICIMNMVSKGLIGDSEVYEKASSMMEWMALNGNADAARRLKMQ